ncbi:LacI family transcriptional regulator [Arthrobacter alpinus]|uniref:LacI family DNA-binding transcriptional regulator n=1 Tax=Arthrobacter alpinus TaxID=656366 RepID=UPI0005C86126|nr:LacI family DNA-binding transcriptional regulator [Arthrobacter alpinus]ALV46714.1 LacI family transcriptional regulator [Arthrobacter alpinus]
MSNPPTRPPSIRDVAGVAGVSPQTVSRVLNGHHSLRPATRDRVQAAIVQLGYHRNYAARSLSTGRTQIIGLVLFNTDSYARSTVVSSIEIAAAQLDHSVICAPISSMDDHAIETAVQGLVDRGADGIILAVPMIHSSPVVERIGTTTPIVTLDGSRTESSELLVIDQALVAELATQHLLDLGHETVWHLAGPQNWIEAYDRSEGWRTTLERAGKAAPPELQGDWSPAAGYKNGLIAARIPDLTAMFVSSDEMAFGLLRALHESGKRIPQDISIVSVDNIALAEFSYPSLTTVAQPFKTIGKLAVQRLLHRLDPARGELPPVALVPELIVRNSTGAPPAP